MRWQICSFDYVCVKCLCESVCVPCCISLSCQGALLISPINADIDSPHLASPYANSLALSYLTTPSLFYIAQCNSLFISVALSSFLILHYSVYLTLLCLFFITSFPNFILPHLNISYLILFFSSIPSFFTSAIFSLLVVHPTVSVNPGVTFTASPEKMKIATPSPVHISTSTSSPVSYDRCSSDGSILNRLRDLLVLDDSGRSSSSCCALNNSTGVFRDYSLMVRGTVASRQSIPPLLSEMQSWRPLYIYDKSLLHSGTAVKILSEYGLSEITVSSSTPAGENLSPFISYFEFSILYPLYLLCIVRYGSCGGTVFHVIFMKCFW